VSETTPLPNVFESASCKRHLARPVLEEVLLSLDHDPSSPSALIRPDQIS